MLTPKGEASKSKLLASAELLFSQKGYHASTVSQIVKNAGLTQASFYQYFKSKEEILEELLHSFELKLQQYVDAGRQSPGKSPEELEAMVVQNFTGLFQLLGENARLTRIALQDTANSLSLREKIVALITANLTRNKQHGIIRENLDPELAAESVVASVERLVYRYVSDRSKTPEELGRQTGLLFLHGIIRQSDQSKEDKA